MAKFKTETEEEISRFIKILIGVVIVILGIYFFTNHFVSKDNDVKRNSNKGEIDSSIILVGSILNRPAEEYYVLAYKGEDRQASIYNTYYSMYASKEDSLNIYIVDLDNELNKSYYSDEKKTDIKDISEIKLTSPILLKIKSNKIVKSVTSIEDIKKELGLSK